MAKADEILDLDVVGLAAKLRSHSEWLMRATLLPGLSSSAAKRRPAIGAIPSVGKSEAVIRAAGTRSGSPSRPRL